MKSCIIENGNFCFILHVEDLRIPFNGSIHANYFEKHYKELGYNVKRINTYKENQK